MVSTTIFTTAHTGRFKAGEIDRRAHRLRDAPRGQPLHAEPVGRAPRAPAPTSSTCARTCRPCSCTRRASRAASSTSSRSSRSSRRRDDRARRREPARHRASPTSARRFWALTWTLAVTDWKLRFYGSVLGYFWSLARPFLLFGVIYLVFSEFAKLGEDVKHYPVYILFALVLFQFFAEMHGQRAELARRPRAPAAQGALPAPRDPAGGRADLAVQPADDARRGDGVRDRQRRLPDVELAAAAAAGGDPRRAQPRHGDAAVGAVRPLPRHRADLGGLLAGAVLRLAGPLRHDDGAGELPARLRRLAARGAIRSDALRDHRPDRAALLRKRSGAPSGS